jgi:hypothetical protein
MLQTHAPLSCQFMIEICIHVIQKKWIDFQEEKVHYDDRLI